jgi:hypothetical protein
VSAWSWLPPALWTCPRCCAIYLVRELGARCRLCGGYHEDGSFVAPSRLKSPSSIGRVSASQVPRGLIDMPQGPSMPHGCSRAVQTAGTAL